jgi:hypothetical protein
LKPREVVANNCKRGKLTLPKGIRTSPRRAQRTQRNSPCFVLLGDLRVFAVKMYLLRDRRVKVGAGHQKAGQVQLQHAAGIRPNPPARWFVKFSPKISGPMSLSNIPHAGIFSAQPLSLQSLNHQIHRP